MHPHSPQAKSERSTVLISDVEGLVANNANYLMSTSMLNSYFSPTIKLQIYVIKFAEQESFNAEQAVKRFHGENTQANVFLRQQETLDKRFTSKTLVVVNRVIISLATQVL